MSNIIKDITSLLSLTVEEILERLSVSKTSQFIGLTYTSKSSYEVGFPQTSRFVINTNVSLNRIYREDIEKLESLLPTLTDEESIKFVNEKIDSLKKSLEVGIGNNPLNTRKDTTESVNGTFRKVYNKDGSFRGYEILGVERSKVVLVKGKYKEPKRESTKLRQMKKRELFKDLGSSKIRCLTVTTDNIKGIRHNGDTLELCDEILVTKVKGGMVTTDTVGMVTV